MVRSFRRAYYDFFSRFYDAVIALHSKDKSAALRDFLVDRASLSSGARVLDLCTGTGAVALRSGRAVGPEGVAVGLDFSRGMLRAARQNALDRGARTVCFVLADAASLPFASDAFDAVTCSHAMYELSPEVRTRALGETRVSTAASRTYQVAHPCARGDAAGPSGGGQVRDDGAL